MIQGRGWGHGVGLAQDGALAMGRSGADVGQILDHFYPGTTDGSAGGMVRVPVAAGSGPRVIVSFPNGGELRSSVQGAQPPGFPVRMPPNTPVAVSVEGDRSVVNFPSPQPDVRPASTRHDAVRVVLAAYFDEDLNTSSTTEPSTTSPTVTTARPPSAGPPVNPVPPSSRPVPPGPPASPVASPSNNGDQARATVGPVVAVPQPGATILLVERNRRFRGNLEIGGAGGAAHVVNELDVEDYLRGMGEVREPSWPPAALQAQAVAARTYALHAMANGGEICGDDRCQVYLSADAEYPAMDDAVRATRSRVRRAGADLATTFYSANGGGVSATPEEGFGPGGPNLSYLRAEPYTTDDPDPWTVRSTLDEAGRKLRYASRLSGARVSRMGPSGRALEVILDGSDGPTTLSGQDFAARMQLRSTLFELAQGGAETAAGLMVPGTPPGAIGGGGRETAAQVVGAQSRRPGGHSGLAPFLVLVVLGTAVVVCHRWHTAVAGGDTWPRPPKRGWPCRRRREPRGIGRLRPGSAVLVDRDTGVRVSETLQSRSDRGDSSSQDDGGVGVQVEEAQRGGG